MLAHTGAHWMKRFNMKKRNVYVLSFIAHATLTIVLNLMSMAWQMTILDSGGKTAPVSLHILSLVASAFTLPLLLPAALAFLRMGYPDPVSSIYVIALIVNSALMAGFFTWLIMKTRRRTRRRPK